MSPALRLLLDPVRFVVSQLYRMGQIGWHWQFDNPNDLYRRRNRLTYTRDFSNAAWTKVDTTPTADAIAAPDGTTTADLLTEGAAGTAVTHQGITTTASTTHTARRTIKRGNHDWVLVGLADNTFVVGVRQWVNVATGALGTANTFGGGTFTSAEVQDLGSGWYSVILTGQIGATTVFRSYTHSASADASATRVSGGTRYEWGAQIELGSSATEYQDVPTTWAQAYLDAVGAQNIYAWTDTAGTTPVTAIGEGIGLLLGREYGGYRGPQLALDPGFDDSSKWALAAGWSISGSTAIAASAASGVLVQIATGDRPTVAVGDALEWTLVIDSISGGAFTINLAGTSSNPIISTPGTYRGIAVATSTSANFGVRTSGTTSGVVSFAGFKKVPGTHLIQATSTARPTLSARVNMFLATEQLDNAAWNKTRSTITANAVAAPDGTTTADKLVEDATAGNSHQSTQAVTLTAAPHVLSVYVKPAERTWLRFNNASIANGGVWFNLSGAGSVGTTQASVTSPTVSALANGWYRCTATFTAAAGSNVVGFYLATGDGIQNYNGDSASGLHLWGADLRTADDAAKNIPAYQRVGATATDHDTDGFPHFMEGDGTDNCMASVATVDGSATDKLTVVSAITKSSDAAIGVLLELSPIVNSNNGSFFIGAPSGTPSPRFRFTAKGTDATFRSVDADVAALSAPVTAVLAAQANLGAPITELRVNDVSYTPNTGALGGNFGNYTLYALSRNGSSLRFNGRFYGSTGRFGPMGDSERNNLTRWWQKRIGTA